MTKIFAIACAALIVAGAAPRAQAAQRKADCLLIVDGKTYINGSCDYSPDSDGSFQISRYVVTHGGTYGYQTRGHGYFASVFPNGDGSATGSWNGTEHASHAMVDLGTLRRAGACWQNERAKVCVWKVGERRYFVN